MAAAPTQGIGWFEFAGGARATSLRVPLGDINARVRFVLLARIADSGWSVPRLARELGKHEDVLRDRLNSIDFESSRLDHAVDLVRQVGQVIGDRVPELFVYRVTDSLPPRRDVQVDAGWWPELRSDPFNRPWLAILAASVLEATIRPLNEPAQNTSSFLRPRVAGDGDGVPTFEDVAARRRLGRALLRFATTSSGHALEAQVALQRLCPVVLDEIRAYLEGSPRWVPCTHILDRALRIDYRNTGWSTPVARGTAADDVVAVGDVSPHAEIVRLVYRFSTSSLVDRLAQHPPRGVVALRLVRRLARDRLVVRRPDLVEQIAVQLDRVRRERAVDGTHVFPVRARRQAIWSLAEFHIHHPTNASIEEIVDDALDEASGDPELSDVALVLTEHGGGYLNWPEAFPNVRPREPYDFFSVSMFVDGKFQWPMKAETAALFEKYVLPPDDRRSLDPPWDRVPRRLVNAARQIFLEMLVYPGFVRTKAAADTLLEAGPTVFGAVARSIIALLRDAHLGPVLPSHVVEGALSYLAYFRHEGAAEALIPYASDPADPSKQALALAALADSQAHHHQPERRRSRGFQATVGLIDEVLNAGAASSPKVLNAGLYAANAVRLTEMWPTVERLTTVGGDDPSFQYARSMAAWCLETWDPVGYHRA